MSEHVSDERLVAYWANELSASEVDAVDEHVFACDACARSSSRIATIAAAFRSGVPPVVSRAEIEEHRARGAVVRENEFRPGEQRPVVFDRDVDLLIHRLGGLDLSSAKRVDVVVRTDRGTQFHDHYVPFDRDRGEVLIACQRHFEPLGADVVFDVHVHHEAPGVTTVATYDIPHTFVR